MSGRDEEEDVIWSQAPTFDKTGRRAFEALAQRSSRRGFLSAVGRVAFTVAGVAAADIVLPVGRADADQYQCGDWQICGFCGYQCGCTGCSGSSSDCPNCACIGTSWTACCCTSGPGCVKFRYKDCFQGSCTQSKFNTCQNCRWCCNDLYPGGGPYRGGLCPGEGPYMCTIINTAGDC
jgi:hypothetical protein